MLRCTLFSRPFGTRFALLLLTASAVANIAAADISSIDRPEVFCGAQPARAEPLVLPPHDFPVNVPISIAGFAFNPDDVTINVGDTVTWTNNDSAAHTSTSNSSVWISDRKSTRLNSSHVSESRMP